MGNRSPDITTLTKNQMAFIRAFIETDDTEKAARIVWPNLKRPRERGNAVRAHPVVSAEIERARAAMIVQLGRTKADTLRELERIAFFDPGCLRDEKGQPRKLADLTEDERRGISVHKFAFTRDGSIVITDAATDKTEALKVLAKAQGLLDRGSASTAPTFNIDVHFGEPETPKARKVRGTRAAKGVRAGGRIIDVSLDGKHVVSASEEE